MQTDKSIQRDVAIKYKIFGLQDPKDMTQKELIHAIQNDFDVNTLIKKKKKDSRTFKQKLLDKYYELYANDDLIKYKLTDGQLDTARIFMLSEIRARREKYVKCIVPSQLNHFQFPHYNELIIPSHTIVLRSEVGEIINNTKQFIFNIDKAFNNILFNTDDMLGLDINLFFVGQAYRSAIFTIQIFNDDDKINNELRKLCEDFPCTIKEFINYRYIDISKNMYHDSYAMSILPKLPLCFDTQEIVSKYIQNGTINRNMLHNEYKTFFDYRKIVKYYKTLLNNYVNICTSKRYNFRKKLGSLNKQITFRRKLETKYVLTLNPNVQ
tara:strand:- start:7225 stop:8196 length:972 start_codon:yes stop_codon:yes gene_type:complete